EAWRHFGEGGSIHLQEFPLQHPQRDFGASEQIAELLKLRGVIGQAIEKARQDKLIGNALEAAVVLKSNSDVTTKIDKEELEEFFILSDLKIEQAKEASALVTKTPYRKCARCWRHRAYVGTSKTYPELCDRCESVVAKGAVKST
ncbi:MAG TPA: zinc finger domain-containing protein, partial [Chthoniobacterales bacterium]|nr:zinc finger domain-containing protein [Chthoniobacterales bacterium]